MQCPPSQSFTPKLVEAYNNYQKQGKQFEVIFCTWDRTKQEFEEYLDEMPWLAVPFDDPRLKQLKKIFSVTGTYLSALSDFYFF